ncbi:hypothetical protein evm_002857 [Chilo suppressalis]|nr:hypothetical protein evm_002857 [Chilo suppressalis]
MPQYNHHSTSKTVFNVCDSEHILCGNCRANGTHNISDKMTDSGHCSKYKRKKKHKESKQVSIMRPYKIDLASGDSNKTLETEFVRKSNQFYEQDPKNIITVTYKNDSYQDNASDTSLENAVSSRESDGILQNCQLTQRPLSCPVCEKIIAVESVLQHFVFDHSKVSRYLLKLQATHRTRIKISDLGEGIKCLSVILLNAGEGTNSCPLLLMTSPVNIVSSKNTVISKKSINRNQDPKVNKSLPCLKDHEVSEYEIGNDIHLLVWLCKITDTEVIYKVTLSREDKKMCFSYTGNAVHIRSTLNSMDIYHKSDCLIIRKAAVKKLVNEQDQILVSVKVIIQDNL